MRANKYVRNLNIHKRVVEKFPNGLLLQPRFLSAHLMDTFLSQESTGDQYVIIERDGEQRRGCLQM